MRRFQIASLIIATAFGSSIALPANADVLRAVDPLHAQRLVQVGRAACDRSFADAQCATYQSRLLKAVAIKAAASSRPVSNNEMSNRQIDALIATIN